MVALSYPPGVVRGATPAATAGRWFDTNLIRWRSGRMMPVGGWERMTSAPLASPARRVTTWADNIDVRHHALGCDRNLYILSGDAVLDATPADFRPADDAVTLGGYGVSSFGAEDWGTPRAQGSSALFRAYSFSLSPWGQDLLAVASFDGRLLHWSPDTPLAKAEIVASAPTGNRALSVTAERAAVLLGVGGNPRQVGWSSREDFTDWDFASVLNTAGYLPIATDGLPMNMLRVREGTLIFTDCDVWLLRFVGAPYVYTLEPVSETTTLMSPNAMAGFGGRAVWMGREGFFIYDGGYVKPLPCDVGAFVAADIDPVFGLFRTHASANGLFPEVWWFYPSVGARECDRYVVWNYEEGWWSVGALARTAMLPAGVSKFPLMAAPNGHLYRHESGWTDAGVSRIGSVFATGGTMRLADGARAFTCTSIMPDLDGTPKAASIGFTLRDAPGGLVRKAGPYVARTNGYMDARFTGRDAQMTVTGRDDAPWSLGVPLLTSKMRGAR